MTPQRDALYSELIPYLPEGDLPGYEGSTVALQTEFNKLPVNCILKDSTSGAFWVRGGTGSYASGARLVKILGGEGQGDFTVTDTNNSGIADVVQATHLTTGTPTTGIGTGYAAFVQSLSASPIFASEMAARLSTVTAGAERAQWVLSVFGDSGASVYNTYETLVVSLVAGLSTFALGIGDADTTPGGVLLRGPDAIPSGDHNAGTFDVRGGNAIGTGNASPATFGGGSTTTGIAGSAGVVGGSATGAGTAGAAFLRPGSHVGGTPAGAYLQNPAGTNLFGLQPTATGQLGFATEVNPVAASIAPAGTVPINSIAGRFRCPTGAGATPIVITNNHVANGDSIILLSKINGAADATQFSFSASPALGGGAFTFTANANATGNVDYAFLVINRIT